MTSKAPSSPPIAPKPKFLTKTQTATPAPTALIMLMDTTASSKHTPAPTNEGLPENVISIGSSVAGPLAPDCILHDSPPPSLRHPSSEQTGANNTGLSSVELLEKKMLERERVWSMDVEQLEAVATKPADKDDSAAERAKIEEEKREQERMSFEAAELELRRKQEEKRSLEMEAKPVVESSKARKRQSAPPSDLRRRTPSSSKEATQAMVGSALQTRRKGVPVRPEVQVD